MLAANANVVVWVNNTCEPDNCNVHLTAPTGGTDRTVYLPAGAYAYDGSLSDDGAYLALSLSTGRDAQGATDQDTGFLVDISSRAVHQIQQTKIPAGETGSLSLNWAPHGWLIVSTPRPPRDQPTCGIQPNDRQLRGLATCSAGRRICGLLKNIAARG